jgi:hypothetical protein
MAALLTRRAGWIGIILAVAAALAGCSRRYSQDTPQDVLASARKMIEDKRAQHLPDLVYADSKDMRTLLNQFGQTLGSLQDLALTVQKAYPKEIAKFKADAEEAAKSGKASSYIQQVIGQAASSMQGGRRRRGGPLIDVPGGENADPDAMRKTFDNALKEVFADPYGWLAASQERLTVQTVSDDVAAIMWDGKPVFGVGLLMRRAEGKWYVDLPFNTPPLNRLMPKTKEGWEVLGGLFQVFDNAFTDLATDVRQGKCRELDDLASNAGEKMFVPAVMVVFAYGQLMDADRKAARAASGESQPAQAPPSRR